MMRINKKLPDIETLIDLYQTMSGVDIAKRYGVSKQAVYMAFTQAGIKLNKQHTRGPKKRKLIDVVTPAALYQENQAKSVNALAKKYDVSWHCIVDYLASVGFDYVKKPSVRADYRKDIPSAKELNRLNQSCTLGDLANKYQCSPQTIRRRLQDSGYEPVKWYFGQKHG